MAASASRCARAVARPEDGRLIYAEGLDVGYRGWQRAGSEPLLAFGSGLGYTSWRFDDLVFRTPALSRVKLTNTGDRVGTQTVQLYLSRPKSGVARPARWLAGFTRVTAGRRDRGCRHRSWTAGVRALVGRRP